MTPLLTGTSAIVTTASLMETTPSSEILIESSAPFSVAAAIPSDRSVDMTFPETT